MIGNALGVVIAYPKLCPRLDRRAMDGVRLHQTHSKRIVHDKGAGVAVEAPASLASGSKPVMKAFFLGILTAVLLAVGSAVVLQGYVQKPVTEAFSTSSVRI
ncbi:MAG TPA: hypothetical protein VEX87_00215 [Skermanella sp.]|jgi:hypothetical protein|nr:hypothetical protein [Skermanella sp.]